MKASVQLDLFEDVMRQPWQGRSPRGLTRAAKLLFFRQAPQRTPDIFDGDQLTLFPELVKKAPQVYRGAPLLQEVK